MRAVAALAAFLFACAASAQQAPAPETQDPSIEEPAAPPSSRERGEREPRVPLAPTVTVTWDAPEALRKLFRENLPPPKFKPGERRRGSLRPWMRDLRRRIPEMAAAEGYFSTTLEIEYEDEARSRVRVKVEPGPRTTVGAVELTFKGDLAGEGTEREARRRELRESWQLDEGKPFRSADWEVAKTRLVEELQEKYYADGDLADTQALVDAEKAKATLKLVVDSGPRFTLGHVEIHGLDKYSEAVVRRSVTLEEGEPYSVKRLQDLQRRLQDGPWFSSVVVDVPRDREHPERVPVKLTVTERPRMDVGLAVGYGTDDGARAEVAFRHRDLLDRGFDLQSSLRISQERQIGYADVYLPAGFFTSSRRGDIPFKDSVGVLTERSTFENLKLTRFAVAGYRHFKLDTWELRCGLSYQIERSEPLGAEERIKRALAPIVAVTWRNVDNLFDPKRGGVLNLQVAAGAKELASGDDFIKTYAQYQHWIPLGEMNQLLLRTEIGRTFTESRERIPEDFLYRAGGSRSNRGYAFQSLGVQEGQAVVGGRYMATGTAELVHWLNDKWGAAAFVDVGDASDTTSDWKGNPSYGVGARFKTPAGPFALDLAYAQDARKFRLAFSVTVAF